MNTTTAKLSPLQKKYRKYFRDKMKEHDIEKLGDSRNKDKLALLFKEVKRGWKSQASGQLEWQERSKSLDSLMQESFASTKFAVTCTGITSSKQKLHVANVKHLVRAFVSEVRDYNRTRVQCSPKKWNEAVARVHRQYREGQPDVNNAATVLLYERHGGTWRNL